MTKKSNVIVTIALVLGVLFSLTACLNPIGFDPNLALSLNVGGEMDIYNASNAVAWVINRTKTVDITLLRIEMLDTLGNALADQPMGYPLNIMGAPAAGHSHASYHKPAKDKNSQPYHYRFTITTRSNVPETPAGIDEREFSLDKYLPSPRDFGIFLVRKVNPNDPNGPGVLEFIDEEPPVNELKGEDTANPPLPPPSTVARYPLIVRNVTRSADVKALVFNQGDKANEMTFAQDVVASLNDQKSFYMPADEYAPTAVMYQVNSTGAERITRTSGFSPRVVVIDPGKQDSQSWHLLFLYFYKSKDGSYKITQQWPPEIGDQDLEDTISGNYTDTRVRVLNKVSGTEVSDIALLRNGQTYVVNAADFSPPGVITGGGFDWNTHSKSAVFKPGIESEIGPFVGEAYTIALKLTDFREKSKRTGYILIKRTGVNMWLGTTYNIIISKDDVKEGEDVALVVPENTYTVTANGGPPARPTEYTWDTTGLTFKFANDVPAGVTPVFTITGPNGFTYDQNFLIRNNNKEFYTRLTTSVDQVVSISCTANGISAAARLVQVYKSVTAGGTVITKEYFYKDSAVVNTAVNRETDHQFAWWLEYDEVTYEDGQEKDRKIIKVENPGPGSWKLDTTLTTGYMHFTKSGLLHIDPRPASGTHLKNDDGSPGWELYLRLDFPEEIDGHYIKNMVTSYSDGYFFGWVIPNMYNYTGLKVIATVTN